MKYTSNKKTRMKYTIIKRTVDLEDNHPDEINFKQVGPPTAGTARTKPVNILTVDCVKPTIKASGQSWKGN